MKSEFFQFPEAAYLFLFLIPFSFSFFFLANYRKRKLSTFDESILYSRPLMHYFRKVFYLLLCWFFAVLALMKPTGNIRYSENKVDGLRHDVILLIDTSNSMAVKDMRTGKSRLDFSKEIADGVIKNLNGQNLAIYAFTSDLTKVIPFTYDYIFSRITLKNLKINSEGVAGTDFVGMLNKLIHEINSDHDTTVILLSDGGDLNYEKDDLSKSKRYAEIKKIFHDDVHPYLHFLTIGVGTTKGKEVPHVTKDGKPVISKMIPDLLQLMAEEKNGSYFNAQEYSIEKLSSKLAEEIKNRKLQKQKIKNTESNLLYDEYFQRPLAFAILLLAIFLITPDNWQREKK